MSYHYQPYQIPAIPDSRVTLLSEQSNSQEQPENIELPLFKHQKTLLTRMQNLESNNRIVLDDTDNSNMIDTNFGIIADKVGSGKTLTCVSLISQNIPPKKGYYYLQGFRYASLIKKMPNENQIDLVIVPHSLVNQWSSAFSHSNCIVQVVKREAHIIPSLNYLKQACQTQPNRSKVLLVNANFSLKLQKEAIKQRIFHPQLCWRRIIIDEAHQTKLSQEMYLSSYFLWLISATPASLRFTSSMVLRSTIGHCLSETFQRIIIKNSDQYVDASIKLPAIIYQDHRCFTPSEYVILENEIGQEIMSLLHSDNVDQALQRLNCNVDTKDNIYKVVTDRLQKKLHNAEQHLHIS